MSIVNPSAEEVTKHNLTAFKGIEVGLGEADPVATVAAKLEAQHPGHLILVQAGTFLHGYDRTAYALAVLKSYKLKLVGEAPDVHLRVGFPVGNFKRRLWQIVEEFGIPYVVALGQQNAQRTIYVSKQPSVNVPVLDAVSDRVVADAIENLRQRNEVTKTSVAQMLADGESAQFECKAKAKELDDQLMRDLMKLPRYMRAIWGESVRECMASIMLGVMAYGMEDNKPQLLQKLSANVDLLKHYLVQAPKLNKLDIAFEHRAGLAVELGKLVGGLIKSTQVRP